MIVINLRVLLCALAVLSTLEPILARRNFGGGGSRSHSYPKSGGLSGGGSHGYPSSGGLSGGGHGYPSSGGMSGGGHGYPSSGGMSGGSHGYPSSGGSHAYPSNTGGAGYPSNTHHSNTHGYPSGKGLSGNSQPAAGHTTIIHNNYQYSPPQQIRYTPVHGGAPVSYPVYHGTPPTYVYQYKDSGSKYGTLLTGLALLNLGTLAAGTAYAVSHSGHGGGSSSGGYTPRAGEVCKFGIRKDNGDYEETKIDCQLISSFILQDQARTQNGGGNNATVTTTTVTNVTVVNTTNGASVPAAAPAADAPAASTVYTMFPNGTLVPLNMTTANATSNATGAEPSPNNTMTSSMTVTTTTTNTTVTNAQDVKGSPIPVTPGMKCYVIRQSSVSNMRKQVDCGLLQTYAEKSIRPNSAASHAPAFTILAAIVAFVLY